MPTRRVLHPQSPPPSALAPDRRALRAYLDETWALYELLFAAVDEAALTRQPDPLRNPLIFYLGHTAAFYVNKLRLAGLLAGPVEPRFEAIFAVGVDPAAAEQLEVLPEWPTRRAVMAYRAAVHERVAAVIERAPLAGPIGWEHPLWALYMALEHDRIHFETSSVLIRQLPPAQVRRPEGWTDAPDGGEPPAPAWIEVPASTVTLGRPEDAPLYGWDNEYGRLEVAVAPFEATAALVSNRDFLAFVREGGYARRALWSAAGWAWRAREGVTAPRFWVGGGAGGEAPRYRGMWAERAMPWAWPAEVNAHEAEAYARWAGARLPTEAEHHALAAGAPTLRGDVIELPGYNLNLRHGSPSPVTGLPGGRSPLGFFDCHGNVWQWLADDFRPLPGFRPHPLYPDFSTPWFDAEHTTLRGGSWATTGAGASRWLRLWFRRHFYQHAGFRLARGGR